jgi:hypothetical protein
MQRIEGEERRRLKAKLFKKAFRIEDATVGKQPSHP